MTLDNKEKKLIGHINRQDEIKVRDSLILLRLDYPDMSQCPVDHGLIKKAMDFLRGKGWRLNLSGPHEKSPYNFITKSSEAEEYLC